tara:strand:- start:3726 stop:3968 length:243 start_codon:yes stop_codon:yes gene_type:complete
MTVLNMINKSRTSDVFDTNFRASCHKLSENNMIEKYRSHYLKLAWGLFELGRSKAGENMQRLKFIEQEQVRSRKVCWQSG